MKFSVRVFEVGETYGQLTVIEQRDQSGQPVRCRCDCGNEVLVTKIARLGDGTTRSCGCLKRQSLGDRSRRHGMYNTKIYHVWATMIARTTCETSADWANYGGRGITVCDQWRDFANFYHDMGEPPAPGMSIDRIDNDAGYSPENCRWATASQQRRNQRPVQLPSRNRKTGRFTGRKP